MLALPTKGMSRSVDAHNIKLDILCDWIEANVLFEEKELSTSDIVSCLLQGNIYEKSDMAFDIVSDAWTEFRRRQSYIPSGTPFSIVGQRITREKDWTQVPAHGFCVLLSLVTYYSGWAEQFKEGYNAQGKLFEELIKESLSSQFSNWNVNLTGWSKTSPNKLNDIVQKIAGDLGESIGEVKKWTSDSANDEGLDLYMYRPYSDNRIGIPLYLMQCASGSNWKDKRKTPDLDIWNKIITFAAKPNRAFAIPYALLDDEFILHCGKVNGMLIDRYRILSAVLFKKRWVSSQLKSEVVKWCEPRIAKLPRC